MSVCALVVTHNRRVLLAEGVRALLAQTHPVDHVIVLDNASTDATAEHLEREGLLADPRVTLERLDVNAGSAGGYAAGIARCLQTGAELVWLLDDDAEPMPDALERLLAAPALADPGVAAVCTKVVRRDGEVDWPHRCRLAGFSVPLGEDAYAAGTSAEVDLASFVGLMVRASVIRAAGLPRPELFINYDDAEYSMRLRRHGAIRLVPEAVVVHKLQMGGRVDTRRSRVVNRLLGTHYAAIPWERFWTNLYGVRNFVWLRRQHTGLGPVGFAALLAGFLAKSLLFDVEPLRGLPWIVRYALKGLRGDFAAVTPAQWTARTGAP